MGMTYEQYWEQSPFLAVAYRKAYRLKRQTDNEHAWLQGLYIYDAFAVCMANAFAKRSAKKVNYLERPIDLFPLTDKEKKRREEEEVAKMQKALEEMVRRQRSERKQLQKGE